jgi:hypothetical protein
MTRLDPGAWLAVLRRYLPFTVAANLVWEVAHLPLYTLWTKASTGKIAFAVVHCTAGDALIATVALVLAPFLLADGGWPERSFSRVAAAAVVFGAGYTVFSEWLNIQVRGSWAYSDLMPVVPVIGTGLSPLLQWLLLPPVCLVVARYRVAATGIRQGSVR